MIYTANISKSLYYYIKDSILFEGGYIYSEVGATLTANADVAKQYDSGYKNWVYKDLTTYPVNVYDNSVLVTTSNYTIDFRNGAIKFINAYTVTGPIAADFSHDIYDISVGWRQDLFATTELPFIVIEYDGHITDGWQIGGGNIKSLTYLIHVYEKSDEEAQDICDIIENKMQNFLPLIDYKIAMPLNFNGSINSAFSETAQFIRHATVENGIIGPVYDDDPTDKEEHHYLLRTVLEDFVNPGMQAGVTG